MSNCVPKIQEINYKEENWWKNFFEKDLANFYSSLKGFIDAKEELYNNLNNDLKEILSDNLKQNLATSIIIGGIRDECIKNEKITDECFLPNSSAFIFRNIGGIGLNNDDLRTFINRLNTYKDLLKAAEGLKFQRLNNALLEHLNNVLQIIEFIYHRLDPYIKNPMPKKYEIKNANDLIKYFEEVLEYGLRLLPLYNPFMFFIQSLRSTPISYLKLIYCEDLFSEKVKNIMNMYGVELEPLLKEYLGNDINEEIQIVGHKRNSIGDLLIKLKDEIYYINRMLFSYYKSINIEDELSKYINKYKYDLLEFLIYLNEADIYYKLQNDLEYHIIIKDDLKSWKMTFRFDKIYIFKNSSYHDYIFKSFDYLDFIKNSSKVLFLGLAWIDPISLELYHYK